MQTVVSLPQITRDSISLPALATLNLDEGGLIQSCSAACEKLFGYLQDELLGLHVSVLLPKLEGMELMIRNEINPRLRYLSHCAIPFLARQHDGKSFAGEVFFNRLHGGELGLQLIVRKLGTIPQ